MPSAAAFKRGFGLTKGSIAGDSGYEIAEVQVGHEVLAQNERYRFPIELSLVRRGGGTMAASPKTSELRKWLAKDGGTQRLYSEYGSPYDCSIGSVKISEPSDDLTITVKAVGTALRDHEAPTLKELQQKAASGPSPPPTARKLTPQERSHLERSHRVMASHFSTGHCGVCGDAVMPGAEIARPKADDIRGAKGGWAHATCVLAAGLKSSAGAVAPSPGASLKPARGSAHGGADSSPAPAGISGSGGGFKPAPSSDKKAVKAAPSASASAAAAPPPSSASSSPHPGLSGQPGALRTAEKQRGGHGKRGRDDNNEGEPEAAVLVDDFEFSDVVGKDDDDADAAKAKAPLGRKGAGQRTERAGGSAGAKASKGSADGTKRAAAKAAADVTSESGTGRAAAAATGTAGRGTRGSSSAGAGTGHAKRARL